MNLVSSNPCIFPGARSLVEACIEGDIAAVRKLLDEGRSVHEPTDEGESLLSLACSAGKKNSTFKFHSN